MEAANAGLTASEAQTLSRPGYHPRPYSSISVTSLTIGYRLRGATASAQHHPRFPRLRV